MHLVVDDSPLESFRNGTFSFFDYLYGDIISGAGFDNDASGRICR